MEISPLYERISKLLADPPADDLDHIELTLTDGYAQALSLEAERWRLEKQIGLVAASLEAGDASEKARELTSLARRLEVSAGDLTRLRGLLTDLRRHADAVRAAA